MSVIIENKPINVTVPNRSVKVVVNNARGLPGSDGQSAYEVALENGFVGTESEWLDSLVGDQGPQGIQGPKGDTGETGPQGATGPAGTTDHGSLTGLGDDDHSQYLLLIGRSGGQTIQGGTGVGENLTLMSNGSGTKGNINFGNSRYDEVNNRWYFGGATGTGRLNFPDAGTTASDGIQFGTGTSNLYRSGANLLRSDAQEFSIPNIIRTSQIYGANNYNANIQFGATSLSFIASGGVIVPAPTLTGSQSTSALSISQTWNTTGSPTAILLNVTNTASGASANLMDLQVGGVSQFRVETGGITRFVSSLRSIIGGVQLNQMSSSGTSTENGLSISVTMNPISGQRNMSRYAPTFSPTSGSASLNGFLLEGTINQTGGANGITRGLFINPTLTSAADFRAIEYGNGLFVVRSSGQVTSLYQRFGSGSPEGVVTAPVGAFYSRTDGGAGTSLYVKESGTGNTGWVSK
jgi:hypothetical protein